MAFITYEEAGLQNLQDQPGVRAAFTLARDLHEDLALKSDERAKELSAKHNDGKPVTSSRTALENIFSRWMNGQSVLTSLPDLSEDVKSRAVILELLESSWLMAHSDPDIQLAGLGPFYADMRAAAAASTSPVFFDAVVTEIEKDMLRGTNPPPSVAQTEYRIIDMVSTLREAQRYTARGEAFRDVFQRKTLHPAEYKHWTNTIKGFDESSAAGIPVSLYAQTEVAVNKLRAMRTQFTPEGS